MKRLVLVYNRRSSRHVLMEREALNEVRRLSGWMVARYEVKSASLEENAQQLARILLDGDLLVAVGGDGTINMALNALIKSGKQVVLGALGYGNFNDFAETLGTTNLREIIGNFEKNQIKKFYPLKVEINDKLWRYAGCYVTIGMAAEVTKIFDEEKNRKKLAKHMHWFSYLKIALWYYKNRFRKNFVPKMRLNGDEQSKMSDVIALNSPKMAGVMRGDNWCWQKEVFGLGSFRLKWSLPLFSFMIKSMFKRVPVQESKEMRLEFEEPATITIQAEGEYQTLDGVKKIRIEKNVEILVVS